VSNIKKCGIFYTDNENPIVTKYALHTLNKNIKDIKIITCSNTMIDGNPFENLILNNPIRCHKNIVDKILLCLNHLKQIDKYDYVSFLEHDVLYPDTYFDFPEFSECICNMNYLGICSGGYQEKLPAQLPLHQMTMNFEFALKHFEKELEIINERGWDCIEPDNVERYENPNPALHINHGKHFTSHYQCYKKPESTFINFWGDFNNIWNNSW